MANLATLNSPKPLSAPGGSLQIAATGVPAGSPIFHKLFLNVTTTSAVSITTLDGTTVTTGTLPVGVYIFDCQFQNVTYTATDVTAIGFYRVDG